MATFVRIVTNTKTINLMDNINYRLKRNRWTPRLSPRQSTGMAGQGPYPDVDEEIELDVLGGITQSASVALQNLEILYTVLEDAARYVDGEERSYAVLQWIPNGSAQSTSDPYESLILGPVESGIDLPVNINELNGLKEIQGVRIRFRRQGIWVLNSQQTKTASATQMPGKWTITFDDYTQVPAPLSLEMSGGTSGWGAWTGSGIVKPGYLCVTDRPEYLSILEAESAAYGEVGGTLVADSANFPSGTGIVRANAATAVLSYGRSLDFTLPAGINAGNAREVAVLAVVKTTATSPNWQVWATIQTENNNYYSTDQQTAKQSNFGAVVVLNLGTVSTGRERISKVLLRLYPDANTGTLDIDYIVLVGLENETSRILQVLNQNGATGATGLKLVFGKQANRLVEPYVRAEWTVSSVAAQRRMAYRGNPWFYGAGSVLKTLTAVWVHADDMSDKAGYWTPTTIDGAAKQALSLTAKLRKAWNIPR